MGQQLRVRTKRKRHKAYLERQKAKQKTVKRPVAKTKSRKTAAAAG